MEERNVRMKRWIAGFLCVCLLGTSDAFFSQAAAISNSGSQEQAVKQEELKEDTENTAKQQENVMDDTGKQKEEITDAAEKQQEDMTDDAVKQQEDGIKPAQEQQKETKENEATAEEKQDVVAEAPLLNYAVVNQPYIETPGTQKVLVGLDIQDRTIDRAVLEYKNKTTGEVFNTEAEEILDDSMMFTMEFENETKTGIYELSSVRYTIDGVEYQADFRVAGMEMLFGVNTEVDSNPDGVVMEEEDVDIDVVTIDENGNTTSQNSIGEAIGEAQSATPAPFGLPSMKASGNVLVVLDPGHDANHPGAAANGVVEKDLNLAIAKYCKAELETYAGVTVQMTRDGDACPYSTSDASTCNSRRVDYAKSIGASVYVSIHNNAGGGNGAEVYYPNQNYNPSVSAAGQGLARKILDNLVKLGLKDRGVKIRNSADGTTYADGSLADYYAVIKNCKKAGIPAIIVEHAFVDSSDAANFLNSDAKLKKLGVADATGIAQYFGLRKKSSLPAPAKPAKTTITTAKSVGNTTIRISWNKVKNASGYVIYRSTKKDSGYQKIADVSGGNTTSYDNKKVQSGKTYYYKVRVRATANDQSSYSSYSGVKSAKTITSTSIRSVKSIGNTKLAITWKEKSGANGYYIYRSTSKDSGYKKIATVSGVKTTSYTDKGIKTGVTYYYKVRSRNKVDGSTGYSNTCAAVSGKTVGTTQISYVKSKANKKLELSWKEVKGANGYYIYRSTSEKGTYKRIATVSGKSTTKYTDTNLTAGETYYYKIKTRNKVNKVTGYSSYSKTAYGTTVVSPELTSVISRSPSKLEINWNSVKGANGYYVYRSTSKDSGYKKIATVSGKNTVKYTDTSLKTGKTYYYKLRSRNKVNGSVGYSSTCKAVNGKTVARPSISSLTYSNGAVSVKWNKISGATGYYIRRATSEKGEYVRIATLTSGSKVSYKDTSAVAGKTYYYRIQAINTVNGQKGYSGYCSPKSITVGSPIIGASTVNVNQMVAYYNRSGKKYPSSVYASKGAANITTFCNIVMQEATAEGVRADVVFAQICNETGFLQFGGDVSADQCNFAGLGATGGGAAGETFKDVRTGIRAQVQHLKAYACKEPLNQTCVDTRFAYVTRGTAPYVEWLGIQENPYGKGWATAKNYGYTLMNIVRTMQTM